MDGANSDSLAIIGVRQLPHATARAHRVFARVGIARRRSPALVRCEIAKARSTRRSPARTGGSLLLTMFMHAAFNNMKDIVPSGGTRGGNPFTLDATLVFRLTVVLLWAVAVRLLIRMRGVSRVDNLFDRRDLLPAA